MAPVLAAVERPEYSEAIAPTSALAVGVTVIPGLVPPPAVTGAVQMLCSVLSEAVKCRTSVYVFPAESVTLLMVAALEFQVPTTTTMRLPAVIADVGVSFSAVVPPEWAETCCTNAGGAPSADAPAEVRAQAKTRLAATVVNMVMVSLPRIGVPGPLVLAARLADAPNRSYAQLRGESAEPRVHGPELCVQTSERPRHP